VSALRAEFVVDDEADFERQVSAWAALHGVSRWHREDTHRARVRRVIGTVTTPCGSGWTGDRCTKPLGHKGLHSNEGRS